VDSVVEGGEGGVVCVVKHFVVSFAVDSGLDSEVTTPAVLRSREGREGRKENKTVNNVNRQE
jgi:hypothetical protein